MLDLKTGRFVINAEKGWELHPFMTREEFMASDFFKSEHLIRDNFDINSPIFFFKGVKIDGYEMFMRVFLRGNFRKKNKYVKKIQLVSKEAIEFYDRSYDETWEQAAYEVKRLHDKFLMHETGLDEGHMDGGKENDFMVEWGSFSSSICLMHQPEIVISIDYDNLTEEDRKELDKIGDDMLWS